MARFEALAAGAILMVGYIAMHIPIKAILIATWICAAIGLMLVAGAIFCVLFLMAWAQET